MSWTTRFYHSLTRHASLQARIYFAAFCTLAMIAFYTFYTILSQQQLAAITHDILDNRIVTMHAAESVKQSIRNYDDNLFRFLSTGDLELLTRRQELEAGARQSISLLFGLSPSAVVQSRLRLLKKDSDLYFLDAERLLQFAQKNQLPSNAGLFAAAAWARNQGNKRQELTLLSEDGKARLNRIFALCDELITLNRVELERAQGEMSRLLVESGRTGVRLGMTVSLVVLLVAIGLALSIVGPLHALLEGVRHVESGNLTVEIPVRSDDEVGELTTAFNRMTRTVRDQREQLVRESITDGLTGLFNQRHFRTLLKQEFDRARRSNESVCLLMIDFDRFKQFNDAQGHEFGNELLKQVTSQIKENIRDSDALARYGGDELSLILPNTSPDQAKIFAEKLRGVVADCRIAGVEKLPKGHLTISIGGASYPQEAQTIQDLIQRADEALYAAKTAGRDCFRWAETGPQTSILKTV